MSATVRSEEAEAISLNFYRNESWRDPGCSFHDFYEISRCIAWINSNGFSNILLEFDDPLTIDSIAVNEALNATGKQFFIRVNCVSCCVDDVSVDIADAVIHYENACLSPNECLPVLYVFRKHKIDIEDAAKTFRRLFTDVKSSVLILYEVSYSHAIDDFMGNLIDYENIILSELDIPGISSESSVLENENLIQIKKCGRKFFITKTDHTKVFYIGDKNETLTNFMLSLNYGTFHCYNPLKKIFKIVDVNNHLKERYFLIEKAKHAKIIAILSGLYGKSRLNIVQHLKELIKNAGKRYVEISGIGYERCVKFRNIDIYVSVTCMESHLTESSELSVITPCELEAALEDHTLTGDYIADFGKFYPEFRESSEQKGLDRDVSLASKMLRFNLCGDTNVQPSTSTAHSTRDELEILPIHSQAADATSPQIQKIDP